MDANHFYMIAVLIYNTTMCYVKYFFAMKVKQTNLIITIVKNIHSLD